MALRRFHSAGILLLAAAVTLPGCASRYGPQLTEVDRYPQCYRPVQQLRDDEERVNGSTAGGAAAGALLGAIIGALASENRAQGALVGAVAGGAAGAVAGHIYAKNEIRNMAGAQARARAAMQCYEGEFRRASEDYRSGVITKEDYRQRYEEIRSGLKEVSYILTRQYDSMAQKDEEYTRNLERREELVRAEKNPVVQQRERRKLQEQAQTTRQWKTQHKNLARTRDDAEKLLAAMADTFGEGSADNAKL